MFKKTSNSKGKSKRSLDFYGVVILLAIIGIIFYLVSNYLDLKNILDSTSEPEVITMNRQEAKVAMNELRQWLDEMPLSEYPLHGNFLGTHPNIDILNKFFTVQKDSDSEITEMKYEFPQMIADKQQQCFDELKAEDLDMTKLSELGIEIAAENLVCNFIKTQPKSISECSTHFATYKADSKQNLIEDCKYLYWAYNVYHDLAKNKKCSANTLSNCQEVDPECSEFCSSFISQETTMCQQEKTAYDKAECMVILTGKVSYCEQLTDALQKEKCLQNHALMVAFRANDIALCDQIPVKNRDVILCKLVLSNDINAVSCSDDLLVDIKNVYCGVSNEAVVE